MLTAVTVPPTSGKSVTKCDQAWPSVTSMRWEHGYSLAGILVQLGLAPRHHPSLLLLLLLLPFLAPAPVCRHDHATAIAAAGIISEGLRGVDPVPAHTHPRRAAPRLRLAGRRVRAPAPHPRQEVYVRQ